LGNGSNGSHLLLFNPYYAKNAVNPNQIGVSQQKQGVNPEAYASMYSNVNYDATPASGLTILSHSVSHSQQQTVMSSHSSFSSGVSSASSHVSQQEGQPDRPPVHPQLHVVAPPQEWGNIADSNNEIKVVSPSVAAMLQRSQNLNNTSSSRAAQNRLGVVAQQNIVHVQHGQGQSPSISPRGTTPTTSATNTPRGLQQTQLQRATSNSLPSAAQNAVVPVSQEGQSSHAASHNNNNISNNNNHSSPAQQGEGSPHVNNNSNASPVSSSAEKREKYTLFLGGMLASGNSLSAKQQDALAKFRITHSISDEDHSNVLALLGLTEETFGIMLQVPAGQDEAKANEEGDLCKICYENPMNCIILPCAHFAICINCSKKLDKCPVCRGSIKEAKVVYKS
jgi:hypothetical protein